MARTRLLRSHADFRRLWLGDGISKIGSSVIAIAVPLLAAATLEATAWQVALLATFAHLPFLLVGLPVGAWADRMRRRPVLVAADLGRAVALAWIPAGAALGVLTIEQLYAVQLIVGVGTAFFDVCLDAYLPTLVGRQRLVEGNGLLATNRTVAASSGPALGGQAVQWLGAPLSVVSAVFGYLWSAAWIASVRTVEVSPRRAESDLVREIREGLRFVLREPFIRATTLFATTAVLCLSTRYAIDVLFLLRTVGLSPGGIGVLMSVAGLGAVAGALAANRIGRATGRVRAVLVASVAMGLSSLLIPLTTAGAGLVLYGVGAGLVAFWITVNNVIAVSLRQMLCPDELLGRMNATSRFLAWATLPAGGLVGGALGTALGLRQTQWVAAVGLVLSSGWVLLSRGCRVRDLPAAATVRPTEHADARSEPA